MAKGPLITDEISILAGKLHEEHPKWTNAMIRNEIRAYVHQGEKSLPQHKRKPKEWPSKYIIDRIMPEIRRKVARRKSEPEARDKPWTIQSLAKYPIPPDALSAVLEVWFSTQKLKSEFETVPSITIRQAEWTARLYRVITKPGMLLAYSQIMADFERQAEIAGLDYFSSQWTTLELFSEVTGQRFTHEEMEKITGLSGHYVTRVGLEEAKRHTGGKSENHNTGKRTDLH